MIRDSILAGIFIGIAGIAYLTIGGLVGAIAFSLGLILVCYQDIPLFTGKAGTYKNMSELYFEILIGNYIGCLIIGFAGFICMTNFDSLKIIIDNRLSSSIIETLFKSIMCGLIMDNIVAAYRAKQNPLPLLLGVPVFIMCGFYHCIADCFYYALAFFAGILDNSYICKTLVLSIVGNFIGCNIRRVLAYDF